MTRNPHFKHIHDMLVSKSAPGMSPVTHGQITYGQIGPQWRIPTGEHERHSEFRTECRSHETPAEVVAQLQEMEESIQRQVLAVLAECQERRRRELWETLKLCFCIICIVGIICITTLLMAKVIL